MLCRRHINRLSISKINTIIQINKFIYLFYDLSLTALERPKSRSCPQKLSEVSFYLDLFLIADKNSSFVISKAKF